MIYGTEAHLRISDTQFLQADFNMVETLCSSSNGMSLITQSEVVRQAMPKEIVRLKELVVNRRNDRINLRVDMMTLQATDDEQHRKHVNIKIQVLLWMKDLQS